jgi:hypothetical protein
MSIPTSVFWEGPVFHTIVKQWQSEDVVTFTFLPENEADGWMYIAGLIPYLRVSADKW